MNGLRLPFFAELQGARSILLAGAGGGFDVYCGLPLYFALRDAGKAAHLANLSFASLRRDAGRRLAPAVVEVTADASGSETYFPERALARWFRARGEDVPVFAFENTGARPLRDAYRALVAHLGCDTILLVDGGTDSLMRGDEAGLGTPHEDIASIAAVDDVEVPRKYLACLGFGVDYFHGVCHAQFLEAVADLIRDDGYLGMFSLTRDMPEVALYAGAARAAFAAMPHHPSIVSSSILSAIEGFYGDHHTTMRTAGSTLWINPLMAVYWCFRLGPVARRILYLDRVKATETRQEVGLAIEAFRARYEPIRPWAEIPV
jgi:hypothetical protein